MTVGELLSRISSAEITEWMALYEIEYNEREHAAAKSKAGIR